VTVTWLDHHVRMVPQMFTRTRRNTVSHGTVLDFETLYPDGDLAPMRVRPAEDTLLRVIAGVVRLTVDGAERMLDVGQEAIVLAGARYRLSSAGEEARVIIGFRAR
jgi:mannose-6-phosphate isomerase-like protein (cupin superfamily)